MGIGLEDYQQLLGDLKGLEIGTLHLERNENSGEEELAYVPGRPEEDPLFRCLRGELEERLAGAIADLPDRERLVMTLYYYEEMTMREIGLALGVVESRVSQMHASAVVHLRAALRDLAARGSLIAPLRRARKPAPRHEHGDEQGEAATGMKKRGRTGDGKDPQAGRDRCAVRSGAQRLARDLAYRGAGPRSAL